MPTVWMRENVKNQTRFHRTPYCRQLRKGPSRGTPHELIELDLNDVAARPCKTCYPDAPRIKILKTYCTICESRIACEHNGGVLIHRRVTGWPQYIWPDSNQMPYYRSA
jgi:hypothetical protein